MGLRFRKSVTLCKGVKLNFGKTGMSVSVGGKGYHKTINTKGQVTTSVGIPGTGIYYTDTKNLRQNSNASPAGIVGVTNDTNLGANQHYTAGYDVDRSVENYLQSSDNTDLSFHKNDIICNTIENYEVERQQKPSISRENIEEIYRTCDENIDWTELLVSTSAEDVFMNPEVWRYLKGISRKVLSGDIDTYLNAIEKMRPVDDLLDYGSDFEFGTDNAKIMEVEFRINADNMLPDVKQIGKEEYEMLFDEYVQSCSIRVARDVFALLPVKYVIVYAKDGDDTVLKVKFDKDEMQKINFKEAGIGEIIERFRYGK
jgi:hypothetical protein